MSDCVNCDLVIVERLKITKSQFTQSLNTKNEHFIFNSFHDWFGG
jgi:hypothetical protein